MVDEIKTYLFDIIKAINEIESFFDNKPKDLMTLLQIQKPNVQLKGI